MKSIKIGLFCWLFSLTLAHGTELHKAVFTQNLQLIEKLVDNGVDVNKINADGIWPLLLACTYGYEEVVKTLIKKGVDVNQANSDGYTALHEAAGMDYHNIVQLLIDAGAKLNKKDVSNFSPLNYAQMNAATKSARILKRHGAK